MAITFDILAIVDVHPLDVHLVRHKDNRQGSRRSVYTLWRDDRAAFELYQSIQARPIFEVGNFVASFVANPQNETLFAPALVEASLACQHALKGGDAVRFRTLPATSKMDT